jgi:hypothetical protein
MPNFCRASRRIHSGYPTGYQKFSCAVDGCIRKSDDRISSDHAVWTDLADNRGHFVGRKAGDRIVIRCCQLNALSHCYC